MYDLDGYLGKIARTFSRDFGVRVVVGGAGGLRTDVLKKIIYIPATAASLEGTDRATFEGGLDHEVGHVIREGLYPEERPSSLMEGCTKLVSSLFNLCEDVALEAYAGDRWPGCYRNLAALRAWACETNIAAIEAGENTDFVHLFGVGFFCRALGSSALIDHALPDQIVRMVDYTEPLGERCRGASPSETLEVAKELAEILSSLYEEPPPSMEIELEGGRMRRGRKIARDDDEFETMVHEALEELGERALTAALGTPTRDIPHPEALAGDRVVIAPVAGHGCWSVPAECNQYVGGLATRIVNLLRAPTPVPTPDADRGWIDSRALSGIKTGSTSIFIDVKKQPERNAVVSILLDGSGSMGGRINVARQAAYTLGCVLHRLTVPFEMMSWDERDGVEPSGLPSMERKLYTRFESRQFMYYKRFDDKHWPAVSSRLARYEAGGNNDDAGAIMDVARNLAKRKEHRKILLVLSDGEPCHKGSYGKEDDVLPAQLRESIRRATAAGILVGGLGICTEYVSEFYPINAHITEIGELPRAALSILKKLLE